MSKIEDYILRMTGNEFKVPCLLMSFILTLCALPQVGYAYAFKKDGIYYNYLSFKDKTVEVTFKYYLKFWPSNDDCNYTYKGNLIIPSTVKHNGVVYTVKRIGDNAFFKNYKLTSVMIPEGVTSLGISCFDMCYGIKHIKCPQSLRTIEYNAFAESGLHEIEIPSNVILLDEMAFVGCLALKKVSFTNRIPILPERIFDGCVVLDSVEMSNTTKVVMPSAFSYCKNLQTIILSDSLTYIDSCAFECCENLKKIVIPKSVTHIGPEAFAFCNHLMSVRVNWQLPLVDVSETAFDTSFLPYCVLYVPKGTREKYAEASVWKNFGKIVEMDAP